MGAILCLDLKREYRSQVLGLCCIFGTYIPDSFRVIHYHRYLLPMIVAGISFILRWIADFTCSGWSQTCRASSEVFSHIYMVVFFFLVIVASTKAKQISDFVDRGKAAYRMLTDSKAKND